MDKSKIEMALVEIVHRRSVAYQVQVSAKALQDATLLLDLLCVRCFCCCSATSSALIACVCCVVV